MYRKLPCSIEGCAETAFAGTPYCRNHHPAPLEATKSLVDAILADRNAINVDFADVSIVARRFFPDTLHRLSFQESDLLPRDSSRAPRSASVSSTRPRWTPAIFPAWTWTSVPLAMSISSIAVLENSELIM